MPECSVVRGCARQIGDTRVLRHLGRFGAPRRSRWRPRPPSVAAEPPASRRHPWRSLLPVNSHILRQLSAGGTPHHRSRGWQYRRFTRDSPVVDRHLGAVVVTRLQSDDLEIREGHFLRRRRKVRERRRCLGPFCGRGCTTLRAAAPFSSSTYMPATPSNGTSASPGARLATAPAPPRIRPAPRAPPWQPRPAPVGHLPACGGLVLRLHSLVPAL